jgi:hypothetical protein
MNGVFVLEPKEAIKERIGRSPDLADAYMQTHAYEDMPNDLLLRLRGQDHAKRDFDPYQRAEERERDAPLEWPSDMWTSTITR